MNTSFTVYSLRNSAASGHDTGHTTIDICRFVDGSGVQHDARDGLCALVHSVWPIPAAVNTSFTVYPVSKTRQASVRQGSSFIPQTTCLEQMTVYNRDLYCTHTAEGGWVASKTPLSQNEPTGKPNSLSPKGVAINNQLGGVLPKDAPKGEGRLFWGTFWRAP